MLYEVITWNVSFLHSNLKGDLAPDKKYTRRDPSAVIKVDSLYYMWYSFSLSDDTMKIAPWDLNDIYYAISVDGVTWTEKGVITSYSIHYTKLYEFIHVRPIIKVGKYLIYYLQVTRKK